MSDSESSKLFCPNCGAMLAPGMRFCAFCGFMVDQQKRSATAKGIENYQNTTPEWKPDLDNMQILYGPAPLSVLEERERRRIPPVRNKTVSDFDPDDNLVAPLYGPPPISLIEERPVPKKKGFWAKLFGR